jgi:MFS family permease
LVEPIKRDLHLNDTQVSLLQGFVFAAFLAMTGLPLGRLVDTNRRVTILAVGIVVWSLATAGSALAWSYTTLLLCRMGVGAGEATLTPAAHSIITDRFPHERLGLALGIFGIGSYVGSGLGLLIGAVVLSRVADTHGFALPVVGNVRPWQMVFVVIGLPGLLVAAWMATLREPERSHGSAGPMPLGAVLVDFRKTAKSMVLMNLTASFTAMASYSLAAWAPTFLIRSYGWSATQAGTAYGLVVIICGITGVILGGALGDYAVSRGFSRGRLLVMTVASLSAVPFAMAATLVADAKLSVLLLIPVTLLMTMSLGILPSAQQAIVHSRMRGMTASLGVLMVNLIGLGLGPTIIALGTDYGFRDPMMLRYSLAAALPSMLTISAALGFATLAPYGRTVDEIARRPSLF